MATTGAARLCVCALGAEPITSDLAFLARAARRVRLAAKVALDLGLALHLSEVRLGPSVLLSVAVKANETLRGPVVVVLVSR